jgi:hypothetical protein
VWEISQPHSGDHPFTLQKTAKVTTQNNRIRRSTAMTLSKIATVTALTGFFFAQAAVVKAADAQSVLIMQPMHGASFDLGSKRVVGYFLSKNGTCRLVLTMAEEPKWDSDVTTFQATRFEAAIPGGKATRYNSEEGPALDFTCQLGAQSISVSRVDQIAGSASTNSAH